MQLEQKQRLEKFRKVSGRLLWFTMPLLILTGLVGVISWVAFLARPIGAVDLFEIISRTNDSNFFNYIFEQRLTLNAKLSLAAYYGVSIVGMIFVLFQFHSVIECFYDGRIFDPTTLKHARTAFKVNLGLIYFEVGTRAIALLALVVHGGNNIGSLFGDLFFTTIGNLIILGFLSLFLWALEMGTDLSEDAALTI